ncbi:hypothetical protein IAR50_001554 [Cryptococcus sp. DSM 104548]
MSTEILVADPYLQYKPGLAYSLPIQILVNGITGTLLFVLLIHVLFTTQYHYPLAPLNYFLQLSSIVVVMISVIIKLVVMLRNCTVTTDRWPYGLDYAAVTIPPSNWSTGQNAAWFLLQALNAGLSNITHIQFLTLLYPSRTEARLIIFVLGPLALVSSALVFTALTNHQTVLDISDAIRNVFNSTLLLIFTISLAIWGIFVNRRRAWRNDGGTAVFGIGSLFLATVSTSFNFVAVAEDGIDWLQHLLFAAVLWQIWLGWWWWVGSGMGIGEVEDIMEKAERKKRKQAKAAARATRAIAKSRNGLGGRTRTNSFAGLADGFTTGVTSILRTSRAGTLTRRATMRRSTTDDILAEEGALKEDDLSSRRRPQTSNTPGEVIEEGEPHVGFSQPSHEHTGEGSSTNRHRQQSTNSETSSTSATPSLHAPRTVGEVFSYPSTWVVVYLRRLRRAHQEAAKKAAIERAEIRQRVFEQGDRSERGREGARLEAGVANGDDVGWGLGRFGVREHQESARRMREAGDILNEERLLGDTRRSGSRRRAEEGEEGDNPSRGPVRDGRETTDTEWEDLDTSSDSNEVRGSRKGRRRWRRRRGHDNSEDEPDDGQDSRRGQGSGWSWWGPLKDWRLNDRAVY